MLANTDCMNSETVVAGKGGKNSENENGNEICG